MKKFLKIIFSACFILVDFSGCHTAAGDSDGRVAAAAQYNRVGRRRRPRIGQGTAASRGRGRGRTAAPCDAEDGAVRCRGRGPAGILPFK